ncbi:MAG: hypothetical protein IRY99_26565, partial [Isosphaeraceae bacterium]|nr:hypothetical protein [Isosphaeraceae bacterium]
MRSGIDRRSAWAVLVVALARLGLRFGLILVAVAVALGRLVPPDEGRVLVPERYRVVNGHLASAAPLLGREVPRDAQKPRLLDLVTGRLELLPLPEGEYLAQASLSPWRDRRGERQLVGRWSCFDPKGSVHGGGLARFRFPSGEAIDRVDMDLLPRSPVCWYPGTRARVLFAAADGQLYQFAFEAAGGLPGADARPQPLAWRSARPGTGQVALDEPTWPTALRLGGRLIVALRTIALRHGDHRGEPARLWWLRLDQAGTAIIAAGPLTRCDPLDPVEDEHFPAVGAGPEGRLLLAYLVRREDGPPTRYELRVAPVHFDPASGAPYTLRSEARALAEDCIAVAPAFTPDDQSIICITLAGTSTAQPRLVSLRDLFPAPPRDADPA